MLPTSTPADVVDGFLAAIGPVLAASAAGNSCAVAAIAMGADDGEGGRAGALRQIADDAFESWAGALTDRLVVAGLHPNDAKDLAATLITVLEGAHVLCRAAGNLRPYEQTARTVTALVRKGYSAP
jgi:hypothetical protein